MTKTVPLVTYVTGQRVIIGEATVDDDGYAIMTVEDDSVRHTLDGS